MTTGIINVEMRLEVVRVLLHAIHARIASARANNAAVPVLGGAASIDIPVSTATDYEVAVLKRLTERLFTENDVGTVLSIMTSQQEED